MKTEIRKKKNSSLVSSHSAPACPALFTLFHPPRFVLLSSLLLASWAVSPVRLGVNKSILRLVGGDSIFIESHSCSFLSPAEILASWTYSLDVLQLFPMASTVYNPADAFCIVGSPSEAAWYGYWYGSNVGCSSRRSTINYSKFSLSIPFF